MNDYVIIILNIIFISGFFLLTTLSCLLTSDLSYLKNISVAP